MDVCMHACAFECLYLLRPEASILLGTLWQQVVSGPKETPTAQTPKAVLICRTAKAVLIWRNEPYLDQNLEVCWWLDKSYHSSGTCKTCSCLRKGGISFTCGKGICGTHLSTWQSACPPLGSRSIPGTCYTSQDISPVCWLCSPRVSLPSLLLPS